MATVKDEAYEKKRQEIIARVAAARAAQEKAAAAATARAIAESEERPTDVCENFRSFIHQKSERHPQNEHNADDQIWHPCWNNV